MAKYKGIIKRGNKYFFYIHIHNKMYWGKGEKTAKEANEAREKRLLEILLDKYMKGLSLENIKIEEIYYKDIIIIKDDKGYYGHVKFKDNIYRTESYYNDPESAMVESEMALESLIKEYIKTNKTPVQILNHRMSREIYKAIREGEISRPWQKYVGYTANELKKHLEYQFKEGMSWDNYGKWHIDHIRPKSSFNFSDPTDESFKLCWSLNNLQPLWAEENFKKGRKYDLI